jgi:hypothetical protein
LQPVERCGGVGEFAGTVVEQALAPPHAAEVETQHRETAFLERVIQVIHHLIIHRSAELRVGMKDERHGSVRSALMMITGLDPSGGTADIHFRHGWLASTRCVQDPSA